MGKLLLAALLGGVVSAAITFFLMTSLAPGDRRAEVETRMTKAEATATSADEKAEVAARRIDILKKQTDAAMREHAKAVARIEAAVAGRDPDEAGDAPVGPLAADGSPYVSRAEMEAAIAKAREAGFPLAASAPPVEVKTLEEIAQEMGLTSAEEASVKQILRESEEEFVRSVFGDRPIAEITAEVKAAKEDPDKMQELVGDAVARGFQNVGKLMTLERRTKTKVENVLGKDKAKDLLARPRKPLLGEDFERVFDDLDK